MNNRSGIAIVFNGLYVGGAEKFGISLANKFNENGFNTTIILFKKLDSPLFDQIDNRIEIVYIHRTSKFDFILHRQFDAAINKRNIQKVVIIGLLPLFLSRVFSFKRNKKIDYFISLHSTIPASFKIYLQNLFFLRFARKRDKILFICNNQKIFYNNKYYFNPGSFDVIYNGVDVTYFKPGSTSTTNTKKESIQISFTDKVILLVATIRKEKGHNYAIESLHQLHNQHPNKKNTHLVFIGGGDEIYITALKKIIKNYSLEQYVHFEGNQKDVRPYYEIADVFTLTSYSVETFSIAALEAMSYGLPISLTNIGGASEMIVEGKNGHLSIAKDIDSIAASWCHLLDAGLDKYTIRAIVVNKFSLEMMFTKYHQVIFQ